MLVKLTQAHTFGGKTTDHPRYPAIRRGKYMPGDILEMPADYFEQHIEPYGFGKPHNLDVSARDTTGALLSHMPVERLREMATDAKILDDIDGTGPNGRVMATDLVTALQAFAREKQKESVKDVADEEVVQRNKLDGFKLKKLTGMAEDAGILDAVVGTGRNEGITKKDLVDALVAWQQAGPVDRGAESNGEDTEEAE